jgi:hypothetical protein
MKRPTSIIPQIRRRSRFDARRADCAGWARCRAFTNCGVPTRSGRMRARSHLNLQTAADAPRLAEGSVRQKQKREVAQSFATFAGERAARSGVVVPEIAALQGRSVSDLVYEMARDRLGRAQLPRHRVLSIGQH